MKNIPVVDSQATTLFPQGEKGHIQFSNEPTDPAQALGNITTEIESFSKIESSVGEESAVPAETAHIDYLAKKQVGINANAAKLDDDDESAVAWRGVLAILALHKLYGFDLQVIQWVYFGSTKLPDVYRGDPTRGLDGNGFMGNNTAGQAILYVLQKKGSDQKYHNLALLSKKMILCPFRSIDQEALEDVPWYDSKKKQWISIVTYLAEKDANNKYQHNYVRSQFQLWLDGIPMNSGLTCYNALANLKNAIKTSDGFIQFTPEQRKSSMAAFNGTQNSSGFLSIPDNTGRNVSLLDVPEFSVTLPSETVFMSSDLLIVPGYDLGDLREKYTVANVRNGQNLVVLLPISKVGVNFLEANPTVTLENVQIDGELNATKLDKLKVTCRLRVDNTLVERTKTYSSDHIHAVWNFPLLSLWPNVRPVCGGQELWKRYYVSAFYFPVGPQNSPTDAVFRTLKRDGDKLTIDNSTIPEQQLTAFDYIDAKESSDSSFHVGTFDHFPQYIHMTYTENGVAHDVGCVYNTLPAPFVVTGGVLATAAVDFGTSNSICVLAGDEKILEVGENPDGAAFKNGDLFNKGRISRLYRWEPKATNPSKVQEYVDKRYDDYLGKQWLSDTHTVPAPGDSYKTQKIRSIAIRYPVDGAKRQVNKLDGTVDGRMYIVDDIEDIIGETAKSCRNIHSGMKKPTSLFAAEGAKEAAIAAAQAVNDLAVHCALEAMMAGASSLEFRFSYPGMSFKGAMDGYWIQAVNYLKRITAPGFIPAKNAVSSMLEGEAAARYFLEGMPDGKGSEAMNVPQGDFAVIDIGGGTSDFTIWTKSGNKATAHRSLSLQFAGNHLIAESILGGLRPEIDKNVQAGIIFGEGDSDEFSQSFVAREFKAFKIGTDLNNIYTTVNGQIADFNRDYVDYDASDGISQVYKGCQKLIQIRVALIFYILQKLIEETRKKVPEFCNVTDENYRFHIYLAGGGSQAFQMCRSTFCEKMKERLSIALSIDFEKYPNVFEIHNAENADKLEVVHGMLFKMPGENAVTIDVSGMAHATNLIPAPADTNAFTAEVQKTYREFAEQWLKDAKDAEELYLDQSIANWFTSKAFVDTVPNVPSYLYCDCEENLMNAVALVQMLNHIIKKMSGLVD